MSSHQWKLPAKNYWFSFVAYQGQRYCPAKLFTGRLLLRKARMEMDRKRVLKNRSSYFLISSSQLHFTLSFLCMNNGTTGNDFRGVLTS